MSVRDSVLGDLGDSNIGDALEIIRSSDVAVRNVTSPRSVRPLFILESERILLDGVRFSSPSFPPQIAYSHDVTVRDSSISSTGGNWWMYGEQSNFTLVRNHLLNGGFGGVFDAAPASLLVCGNTLEGGGVLATLDLEDANGARIVGNRIMGSRIAVYVTGVGVSFERNDVSGGEWWGATFGHGTTVVANNSFHDVLGVFIAPTADARNNWWGDASGPSDLGPGTGIRLHNASTGLVFEPWLASPPTGPVNCDAEVAPAKLPVMEPVEVTRLRSLDGLGARVALDAAPGEEIVVEVSFAFTGDSIEDLTLFEDENGYFGLASSWSFGNLDAEVWGEGLRIVYRDPVSGNGGFTLSCRAPCPRSAVIVVGASEGLDATLVVRRTQPDRGAVIDGAVRAGLLTQDQFSQRGTGVILDGTGVGDASTHSLVFHKGFFGFSWADGASLEPRGFRVDSAEGMRDANSRFYLGELAGVYTFRADAWKAGSGEAHVLYADLR